MMNGRVESTEEIAAALQKLIVRSASLDEPPTLAKERLLQTLGIGTGLTAGEASGHPAAIEPSRSVVGGSTAKGVVAVGVKALALATVVAGIGAVLLGVGVGRERPLADSQQASRAPLPRNALIYAQERTLTDAPSPPPEPSVAKPSGSPAVTRARAPKDGAASLSVEVRLLDAARAELARAAYRQALARLDDYERRFRDSGTLRPEAAALRLEAQKALASSKRETSGATPSARVDGADTRTERH